MRQIRPVGIVFVVFGLFHSHPVRPALYDFPDRHMKIREQAR
jgi:hypothetical protein